MWCPRGKLNLSRHHPASTVCETSVAVALLRSNASVVLPFPALRIDELERRISKLGAVEDFDQVVEQYHRALGEFMKGNPEPAKKLFSHRDDVALGNPFGPFARGWKQVVETMERAASNYRDGDATSFENVAKCVTSDLAYIVEVERLRSKVGGQADVAPLALRVTSIFRPEDGVWKIVHRHADPITTVQPAQSVLR